MRLAFNRKNKKLRGNFTTSTVLALLESNAKTVASLAGKALPVGWDAKAAVEEVLAETGMAQKQARLLSVDDFLALLAAFNAKGLHFAA